MVERDYQSVTATCGSLAARKARLSMAQVPPDIEAFIKASEWPTPEPEQLPRMRAAYDYFLRNVDHQYLARPVDDPAIGANPFAFKINGRVPNISAWMQAIDFDHPVNPHRIVCIGDRLKAFRDADTSHGSLPCGNWYTVLSTPHSRVALPPGQTAEHEYVAGIGFNCLESVAGDVLVDWTMRKPSDPYWYRHGGGAQLFIVNAASKLKTP